MPEWIANAPEVRHIHHRPARPGLTAALPDWVSPAARDALSSQGITALWQHQRLAADALYAGRHVAISTATSRPCAAAVR